MVKIRTLNNLEDLGSSAFNQPDPRRGLRLLYWFACAKRNGQLDPKKNTYGFHKFHNRIDDDDNLLPNSQNLPYYEVGNLNAEGADKLPSDVRPHNGKYYGDHNKDRIIVCLRQGRIDKVYVTEHENPKDFSHERTYRISEGLLDQISNMNREKFIKCMEQQRQVNDSSWSWCTIL